MTADTNILSQLIETLKPFTKKGQHLGEDTELVSELGLDSLQVMQVLLKIEDQFDISIPLNNIPNILTVKELAQEIEKLLKQNPRYQGYGYWGVGSFSTPSYVDYFCKKDGKYFLIDVKHKTFNQDKTMNQFFVTNTEVLNYDRIMKGKMVVAKILIVLEKDHKLFYKMCDWNDFIYSKNYDPHKTRKTIIRLKNGFDISKLIKF